MDYIIVYMLLSMTPLCYGTTDILNLITDGSLWNNYKEKIGQQPQWFHACSSCVFSTILSSPSTLKNNVNYQPDHTAGQWEVDWGNDSMSHLAPQAQVSAEGVPTATKAGWWPRSTHCQRRHWTALQAHRLLRQGQTHIEQWICRAQTIPLGLQIWIEKVKFEYEDLIPAWFPSMTFISSPCEIPSPPWIH